MNNPAWTLKVQVTVLCAAVVCVCLFAFCGSGKTDAPLEAIVKNGAVPVRINPDDYQFTEGPANNRHGMLFFVDTRMSIIVKHDWMLNTFDIWAENTQVANGSMFTTEGKLISCRPGAGDVVAWKEDGTVEKVLVSEYEGKPLGRPNDLVISKTGWIYFTDSGANNTFDETHAFYALSPGGRLIRFEKKLEYPNGIILSPDEKTLIINGNMEQEVMAYDVNEDGTLTNRHRFADVVGPDREKFAHRRPDWFGTDGMTVDVQGNVYITTGGGVEVFDKDGTPIGIIELPMKPTNVVFGGPDTKTLYITAQHAIFSLSCNIPGIIFQQ